MKWLDAGHGVYISTMISRDSDVVCLRLHENLEWKSDCVALLNSQWPRSVELRKIQVERCCHSGRLPAALLLVDSDNHQLIGYAKISSIAAAKDLCLVESVVIAKSHRRKGFGRQLMAECEKYAKQSGFSGIYLTTHDQLEFYSSLGYTKCSPICTGADLVGGEKFQKLQQSLGTTAVINISNSNVPPKRKCVDLKLPSVATVVVPASDIVVPPPPPPPLVQEKPKIFHLSKVL